MYDRGIDTPSSEVNDYTFIYMQTKRSYLHTFQNPLRSIQALWTQLIVSKRPEELRHQYIYLLRQLNRAHIAEVELNGNR